MQSNPTPLGRSPPIVWTNVNNTIPPPPHGEAHCGPHDTSLDGALDLMALECTALQGGHRERGFPRRRGVQHAAFLGAGDGRYLGRSLSQHRRCRGRCSPIPSDKRSASIPVEASGPGTGIGQWPRCRSIPILSFRCVQPAHSSFPSSAYLVDGHPCRDGHWAGRREHGAKMGYESPRRCCSRSPTRLKPSPGLI